MKIRKRRQSKLNETERVLESSGSFSLGQLNPINQSHSTIEYGNASPPLASIETSFKLMSEQHDRMRAMVLGSPRLKLL